MQSVLFQAVISTIAVVWSIGLSTANIIAAILCVLNYLLFKNVNEELDPRARIMTNVLSALFSVCLVAGNYSGYQSEGVALAGKYLISLVGLFLLFKKILIYLFDKIKSLDISVCVK